MAIDPQNLSGTATLTFNDDFNTLNLRNGGSGTWSTNYWWGQPNGVTLAGNGEQEWYVDANFAGTQSVKPWTVNNGVLDLTAQNASPEIQQQIDGYKYTSGMLTSHDSFSQTYGYFEMKAELPQGAGLWPAFWLLPENGAWPPEIDVMEQLGHDPNTYYTAAHTLQSGAHTSQGGVVSTPDLTTGYHTYGMDWEADKLTYYFDGKQAWQTDTPADMHDPMYMLVNLAVGGYWPGNPTPDANYSETMHVDYVRAYSAKPAGAVTPAASDTTAPATTATATTATTDATAASTSTSTQASATVDSAAHTDTNSGATTGLTSAAPATHLPADAAPISAAASAMAEPAVHTDTTSGSTTGLTSAAPATHLPANAAPISALASATVDPAVHTDTTSGATFDVTSATPGIHLSADAATISLPASDIATASDADTTSAPASTSLSEAAPSSPTPTAPVETTSASSTSADAFNFAALAPQVKPATTTASTTQQSIYLQSAVDAASPHKGHGHHDSAAGHGAHHHVTSDFAGPANDVSHDHGHAHAAAHHHWAV